jgi:uncharacterized DUF497 family protein
MKIDDFEWDDDKAVGTDEKHGVEFYDAAFIFANDDTILIEDIDEEYDERRFWAIGCDDIGRVLVVTHVYRKDKIRLISARLATKNEVWEYDHARAQKRGF